MDEGQAHYVVTIGEACAQARLLDLMVEVVTMDGRSFIGVPRPHEVQDGDVEEVDSTGYAKALDIDDATVALDEIVELRLHRPAEAQTGRTYHRLDPSRSAPDNG